MSIEALNNTADFASHHIEGYARMGNTPFTCPLITPINDMLWQGGCRDKVSLGAYFKHVVSLYPWERYRTDVMLDSLTEVKLYDSHGIPDLKQIEHVADWVNICRAHGRTLIHCQAGLNRSALIASLALMRGPEQMSGKDVVALLREKRSPAVLCNSSFEAFVLEYKG